MNERAQRAAGGSADPDEQLKAVAPVLKEGYAWQRPALRDFQALEPPADDRDVIDEYMAAQEESTALVGRLVDAAEERDVVRFTELSDEQERIRERSQGIARGYGFKECGSGRNEAG